MKIDYGILIGIVATILAIIGFRPIHDFLIEKIWKRPIEVKPNSMIFKKSEWTDKKSFSVFNNLNSILKGYRDESQREKKINDSSLVFEVELLGVK